MKHSVEQKILDHHNNDTYHKTINRDEFAFNKKSRSCPIQFRFQAIHNLHGDFMRCSDTKTFSFVSFSTSGFVQLFSKKNITKKSSSSFSEVESVVHFRFPSLSDFHKSVPRGWVQQKREIWSVIVLGNMLAMLLFCLHQTDLKAVRKIRRLSERFQWRTACNGLISFIYGLFSAERFRIIKTFSGSSFYWSRNHLDIIGSVREYKRRIKL